MSDTPRTDTLLQHLEERNYTVFEAQKPLQEHARQLEREVARLRGECKRLDDGLNRACARITDLQRPPAVMGITMKFETHCPDGQMCGATTTGCMEGECQRDPRLSQPRRNSAPDGAPLHPER